MNLFNFTAMLLTCCFIVFIGYGTYFIIDEIIKTPTMLFDEHGEFAGWEKPKYNGLADFAKRKVTPYMRKLIEFGKNLIR